MNVKDLMDACPNLEVVVVGDKPAAAKPPVDVLDLIAGAEIALHREWPAKAERLREARAAVAELVAAAKAAVEAIHDGDAQSAVNELHAALAKFGGAV